MAGARAAARGDRGAGLELAPRLAVYPEYSARPRGSTRPCCRTCSGAPTATASPARTAGRAGVATQPACPFVAARLRLPARPPRGARRGRDRRGSSRPAARSCTACLAAADALRREVNGDDVTYVVTRNVNYTNVCYFRCGFCAFSKGRLAENLRGTPYLVPVEEIVRRGARGVGSRRGRDLPPGRDPPGVHRRDLPRDLRRGEGGSARTSTCTRSPRSRSGRAPRRSGSRSRSTSRALRDAGLASLPGHGGRDPRRRGARASSARTRSRPSSGSTSTTRRTAWACARRRRSCSATSTGRGTGRATCSRSASSSGGRGGFTEFVPLPFVHMEAPIYLQGRARPGPTFREALLMHAVARLALHPWITNVQASWVKLGVEGAQAVFGRARTTSAGR